MLGLRLRHEGLLHLLIVLHHVALSLLLARLVEVLLLFQVFVDLGQVQGDVLGLSTAVGVGSLNMRLVLKLIDSSKLVLDVSHRRLLAFLLLVHLGLFVLFGLLLVEWIWDGCVLVVLGVAAILGCGVLVVIASSAALLLVFLENGEAVGQLEDRLLHLEVEDALVLAIHRAVNRGLNVVDSFQRVLIPRAEILDLLVGNESLLWLLALLVEDAKVVPYFILEGVQRRGFDDVLERVAVVAILVVDDGERGPIGSLARVLSCGLLE